jgi:hypothetical protein
VTGPSHPRDFIEITSLLTTSGAVDIFTLFFPLSQVAVRCGEGLREAVVFVVGSISIRERERGK